MVHDRQIAWKRHNFFLPAVNWQWGGHGVALNILQSPTMVNVTGHLWNVATTQADNGGIGDKAEGTMLVPWQWNPEFDIGVRLWFNSDVSVGFETVSFIMLHEFDAVNTAIDLVASTALDTPWGLLQAIGTLQDQIYVTSRGIINAGWATRAQIHAGHILSFSVELDAVANITIATEEVCSIGLEFDYMPMETRFPHSEVDGGLDDSPPN